jgi:hypothetical protein
MQHGPDVHHTLTINLQLANDILATPTRERLQCDYGGIQTGVRGVEDFW